MAKTLAQGRKPGSGRKPGKGKTLREGRKPGSGRRRRDNVSTPPTTTHINTNDNTMDINSAMMNGTIGAGSPPNGLSEIQRFNNSNNNNNNNNSSNNSNNNGMNSASTRVMDAVEALRDLTKSPNLGNDFQNDTSMMMKQKQGQQTFIEVMPQGPYFSQRKMLSTPNSGDFTDHLQHESRQNMHLDMHVRLPDRRILSIDNPQNNVYMQQRPNSIPSPQYQRSQQPEDTNHSNNPSINSLVNY